MSRVSPDWETPITSVSGADHRIAVDPLRGDVGLDRQPRPLLEHVPGDDARVVGGAAGEQDDPAQVAQLLVGEPEALELELAVADAVADRLGDGLGLLVDLLEHERLVAALLGALVVPVELDELVLDRRAVGGAQVASAVGREHDDVAVVGELDRARLAQEGDGVRGEEHLALADPDDERRLVARSDEQVGMVVVDRDEGEVPFELVERLPDGFHEIALVVALDQVGDGLGVRLGRELVALVLEAAASARGSSRRSRSGRSRACRRHSPSAGARWPR